MHPPATGTGIVQNRIGVNEKSFFTIAIWPWRSGGCASLPEN
jgi:hypothetical protein